MPLSVSLFLSHLVVLPGQESKREKRRDVQLRDFGDEEEAGADISPIDGPEGLTELYPLSHQTGDRKIQSWISGLESSKGTGSKVN